MRKTMVGAGVLLISLGFYAYNSIDIASDAIRFRLQALGASIYEYRASTGNWPVQADDLTMTSMALRMRFWQEDIQSGRVVVVWPQNWQANPSDNAGRVLAYYSGGLISALGNWVCWGDLRTEYLSGAKLEAALKAAKAATADNSKLETRN